MFGKKVVDTFMEKHGMDLVVRAHQVVAKGYEFFAKRKLVTVFSAPNYMNEFDNSGAGTLRLQARGERVPWASRRRSFTMAAGGRRSTDCSLAIISFSRFVALLTRSTEWSELFLRSLARWSADFADSTF